MMRKTIAAVAAVAFSMPAFPSGVDDPLLYKVMIDKLEVRDASGPNPVVWDAEGWIGRDLDKFWIKSEGERADDETEDAEVQFLYSRAVAPFWDFQIGWRRTLKPDPDRDFLALGFKGLAPYFFDVDANIFIGESGRIGARLNAEYEYLFTQRLILSPEIEINLNAKDDEAVGIGSGLSDMELGVRLRYEIRREFAPYVGVNWSRKFGKTADYAEAEGGDTNDVQVVAGFRIWF